MTNLYLKIVLGMFPINTKQNLIYMAKFGHRFSRIVVYFWFVAGGLMVGIITSLYKYNLFNVLSHQLH